VLGFQGEEREGEARRLLGRAYAMEGHGALALQEYRKAIVLYQNRGLEAFDLVDTIAETALACWHLRRPSEAWIWVDMGVPLARKVEAAGPLHTLLALGATLSNLKGDFRTAAEYLQEREERQRSDPSVFSGIHTGVLHIPLSGSIHSLDPAGILLLDEEEAVPLIFETLTRHSESAGIQPWLATKFEMKGNGRAFVFHLRRDIHFHNGRLMTADDVRFSLLRMKSSGVPKQSLLSWLQEVEILSDFHFIIHLKEKLPIFPALLADTSCAIVPSGMQKIGKNKNECIGSGPFRLVFFEPGKILELEPNKNYWRKGLPRCERIIFTFGVSPDEIYSGFCSGLFSIAWDLRPEHVEDLLQDRERAAQYQEIPRLATYYIALNSRRGPLAEEHVRAALISSLDKDRTTSRYVGRSGSTAASLIPPGLLGYEEESAESTGDLDTVFLSTEELKPLPKEVRLSALIHPIYKKTYARFTNAVLKNHKKHGFSIRVLKMISGLHQQPVQDYDLQIGRWIADYMDPDAFTYLLLHSESGLDCRLCGSSELDEMIVRGRTESNPLTRHKIYQEIEDYLSEKSLLVPLFHEKAYRFASRNVQGFRLQICPPILRFENLFLT
jgi:peptide/nickel transport system substrate-binding protein